MTTLPTSLFLLNVFSRLGLHSVRLHIWHVISKQLTHNLVLRAASWGTARAADAVAGMPARWSCGVVPCPQQHQNTPDRRQHDHKVSKLTIQY